MSVFSVTPECIELGLRAGAVVFRNLHIGPSSDALRSEIGREVAAVRQRFADLSAVHAAPEVAAFAEIHRRVGASRKDLCSTERLVLLAPKRGQLPAINALVDAYNLVSIRSLCSLGAHDLERIVLPVSLEILDKCREFVPLGGTTPAAVNAGEYAYVDGADRVLCRLDVVQADFSKVTPATTSALLIIEATATHSPLAIKQAFDEAIEKVTRHCGGSAEIIAVAGAPGW